MANPSPPRSPLATTTQNWRVPSHTRLVSLLRRGTAEAEQFRCLRYAVLNQLTKQKCNVIAVTSPDDANGKTSTAINLAAALEEQGIFRVLLVDADLRKAAIAERLELGPVKDDGLDSALANWSLDLADVVRRFPAPYGLDVLPAAARPDVASLLVASPRLGMLLLQARALYDFIVIDTPPLVPLGDCRAIAPWIDGFLVVVAAHETQREALEEGLNAMTSEKILGLVFSEEQESSWFSRSQI